MNRPGLDYVNRTDPELVRLAKAGEFEAYGVLIQRCNQRLFRLARAILGNDADAEDALQDTYVRAFAALPGFREEAAVTTWLTRILLNEARGRLRRRRETVDLAALEAAQADDARVIFFPGAAPAHDPERRAATTEARRLLERAVDELPAPFRVVFMLREVEGLSVEDTANALGLRPETVKTRLHRARLRLREALDAKLASALQDTFPFLGARCEHVRAAVLRRIFATGPDRARGEQDSGGPRAG